jgi:hypothetical protein
VTDIDGEDGTVSVSEEVALAQAARTAGLAPSIHNTQPWRWRVDGSTLDLRAERSRQLAVTDPGGRMLAISCGAALHHARVALAAEGWAVTVNLVPDDNDQDLLARLTVTGREAVTPAAMRLLQTARIRHTDRRPLSGTPVDPAVVDSLRAACSAEGTRMHVLRPDAIVELAASATRAQAVEELDPSWRDELAYWAGGARDGGLGLPDEVIPSTEPATTVPGRCEGCSAVLANPSWCSASASLIRITPDRRILRACPPTRSSRSSSNSHSRGGRATVLNGSIGCVVRARPSGATGHCPHRRG